MDAFDDFEIKPLTKGLGFHKKSEELKSAMQKSIVGSSMTSKSIPDIPVDELFSEEDPDSLMSYEDLLSALETPTSDLEVTQTFERPSASSRNTRSTNTISDLAKNSFTAGMDFFDTETVQEETPFPGEEIKTPLSEEPPFTSNIPALDKTIANRPLPKVEMTSDISRGATNSPGQQLTPASFSISAAFLDVFVVLGISMLSLVMLLIVTGVELSSVVAMAQSDFTIQMALVIMYVSIYQIYVIGSRSISAKTLGEWTFGLQLGNEKEQRRAIFPLKVLWRGVMILLTGVVTMPLLSIIFRKDLMKYLSGLQLYSQA
ncbi:MAG: hypothetical protein HOO06_09215 [Bdellovibrionaceae bacterium]|jgi:hypothetical protein|nr:hypothetical protein [Pseudobdellovibrionaceae bacterium]